MHTGIFDMRVTMYRILLLCINLSVLIMYFSSGFDSNELRFWVFMPSWPQDQVKFFGQSRISRPSEGS